ncbi:Aaa-atpase [Thalictrum thalictroides]|uniref:Aaa-atpase n=1 Tax=Thalictrum thalictroides TaxID=46969 RepID=A0A7J6VXY5_THATH|nr:Aaa-atpase [Thalictrum thalictroides]
MDMHIHMSYCTPCGFKLFASNYPQIQYPLFEEIELLIKNVNATPAVVAEELMKSDNAKTSLEGLRTS